jgi:hypothetical protein
MPASLLFFANAAGVEEPSTFQIDDENVSTRGPFQYAPAENANDAATKIVST